MTREELLAQARWCDEAREEIADWAGFASEYFQDKYDLVEVLAKWQVRARELRAQAEAMNNGAAPNAGRAHENLGAAGSATADAAPPDLAARVARLEGLLRVLIDEAENMANDYHPRYARVDEAIESARAALAKGK